MQMTNRSSIAACLLLIQCFPAGRSRADEWMDLTKWLPASTNALVVVDIESLYRSQFAKTNGWRESAGGLAGDGLTMLPSLAKHFALATELDMEHLEPLWELGAISLLRPVDLQAIRDRTGGQLELLGGINAIRTPRGSYITAIAPQNVALVRIAEREWASRAIQEGALRQSPVLPSFLATAANRVEQRECQVAVAVKLDNPRFLERLREAARESEWLTLVGQNTASLQAKIDSLEGVMLTVRIDESLRGRLEVVFQQQPDMQASESKTLILSVLERAGASLPEFANWKSSIGIHTIVLEGELSAMGLSRVLSLLHYDTSDIDVLQSPASALQATRRSKATARYVKIVNRLIDALANGAQNNNLNTQLLWADRSAKEIVRAIDEEVDSQTAELGYRIAYQLEGIVSTFNNAADVAQAKSAAASLPAVQWQTELVPYSSFKTPYGRFYRYTPFSYARVNLLENNRRADVITTEHMNVANQNAKQKFSEIELLLQEMNRLVEN